MKGMDDEAIAYGPANSWADAVEAYWRLRRNDYDKGIETLEEYRATADPVGIYRHARPFLGAALKDDRYGSHAVHIESIRVALAVSSAHAARHHGKPLD